MMTTNNNEEFDLFSELDDEEKKELGWTPENETNCCVTTPTSTKGKKSSTPVSNKSAVVVEKEPDEYEIDRVVFYAGHRMEVPSRTMKKEDVRVWLEETFPELKKDNTEMIYDEKTGHLVPVLKGHKKGSVGVVTKPLTVYPYGTEPNLPKFYRLGWDGDVEEVRDTQVGRFVLPVLSEMDKHNHTHLHGMFTINPSLPLPPLELLEEIVDHFVAEPEIEHLANIVWDTDHYEVVWPDQIATSVNVFSRGMVETETRFIFLQIHSHGRLDAFFSGTDDRDEVKTGLYGVIGNVGHNKPHAMFRMSVGGRFDWNEPPFDRDVESVVWVK